MRIPVWIAFLVVLIPAGSHAQERWDHRGSLGVLVGGGADTRAVIDRGSSETQSGWTAPLEVGVSLGLLDSGDLILTGRIVPYGKPIRSGVLLGYRGYFGHEAFKTFFDVGLLSDVTPAFTIGPRLGFGVQYELSPIIGIYLGAAGHVGAGNGIRFGGEIIGGFQFRSYLLE